MDIDYLYDLIKDIMTKDRFIAEINERKKMYNDLLDDEAIAYMIVDELGRNPGNWVKIKDLIDDVIVSIYATVDEIEDSVIKKNERELKLRKIKISDETGSAELNLWNDEIENFKLEKGDKIKIINCYVKIDKFGLHISLGKWGSIVKL